MTNHNEHQNLRDLQEARERLAAKKKEAVLRFTSSVRQEEAARFLEDIAASHYPVVKRQKAHDYRDEHYRRQYGKHTR